MISMLVATVMGANVYYGRSTRGNAQSLLARGYVVQVELASKHWNARR
jgi:hypothetical protein